MGIANDQFNRSVTVRPARQTAKRPTSIEAHHVRGAVPTVSADARGGSRS